MPALLLNLLTTAELLAVTPWAVRRLADPGAHALSRVWLLAAAPAAFAVWMPHGPDAVAMTLLYLTATLALACCAPLRLLRTRSLTNREITLLLALGTPFLAAAVQAAERLGATTAGLALTPTLAAQAHLAATAVVLAGALLPAAEAHGAEPAARDELQPTAA
ncbi:YndJ family transporter [Yinghuangia seranimata]|uniref:YndJ family transporter n=1 Tax=Yinghuangia seranimata TaxID=408067 RepID=UPI00248CA000|nr:YndJ family transporter [Yinghuangia seranimata]MDI2129692.1 YndJ family transporter [Yinghuangia seranimata]